MSRLPFLIFPSVSPRNEAALILGNMIETAIDPVSCLTLQAGFQSQCLSRISLALITLLGP